MKKILYQYICLNLLLGCELEYHPYEKVGNTKNLSNHNVQEILSHATNADTFVVPFITDTQRALDETSD
jgi:hypothetical protein